MNHLNSFSCLLDHVTPTRRHSSAFHWYRDMWLAFCSYMHRSMDYWKGIILRKASAFNLLTFVKDGIITSPRKMCFRSHIFIISRTHYRQWLNPPIPREIESSLQICPAPTSLPELFGFLDRNRFFNDDSLLTAQKRLDHPQTSFETDEGKSNSQQTLRFLRSKHNIVGILFHWRSNFSTSNALNKKDNSDRSEMVNYLNGQRSPCTYKEPCTLYPPRSTHT